MENKFIHNISRMPAIINESTDSLLKHTGLNKSIEKDIVKSYMTLRSAIGILGILIPFFCIIGGLKANGSVENSISDYYHTNMRDLFVGLLICISMFLVTYKGDVLIDKIITTIIGFAGFGVIIFPCSIKTNHNLFEGCDTLIGILQFKSNISGIIHLSFAVTFFFLLAINSIFLFPYNNEDKKKFVYRICGGVILLSLVLVFIFRNYPYAILICEIIMLFAFGISWIWKGKSMQELMNKTLQLINFRRIK